jgi:hypothetical protein
MHSWGTVTPYRCAHRGDVLVLEHLAVGDGGVRLDEDVLALAVGDELVGGVADVDEQLVDVRGDPAAVEDVLEVLLLEVRDADGAQLAGLVGVLERAPGLPVALRVVTAAEVLPGLRAVDEHEVEVVEAHRLEGAVDGGHRAVVVLDLGGELAGDEDLPAGDAAGADAARTSTRWSPRGRALRPSWSVRRPATVGHREDLEDVPVGVEPVEPAAAVPGVDLLCHPAFGIGPVREPAVEDPAVDLVEGGVVDEERVVLRVHRALQEVQGDVVRHLHHGERPEGRRGREPEDAGEEGRRDLPVGAVHDRVVELHRHGGLLRRALHGAHGRLPREDASSPA